MSLPENPAYHDAERRLFAAFDLEVEEHWIDGGGFRLRVLASGRGEPLLLLHGSPNTAATMAPLAARLPHRRCLMLERPGAGLSEPPPTWGRHRDTVVGLLEAALDQLGLDRVDVAGSSFGGLYALELASARPHRVASVTLLGCPGGVEPVGLPRIFRFLALPGMAWGAARALRPDLAGARKAFRDIGHAAAIDAGAFPEPLLPWYVALMANTDTAANLVIEVRSLTTVFGARPGAVITLAELAALRCPFLVLWGTADTFGTVAQGRQMADAAPDGRFVALDDLGHLPWVDDAAGVASELDRFLAVDAPSAG